MNGKFSKWSIARAGLNRSVGRGRRVRARNLKPNCFNQAPAFYGAMKPAGGYTILAPKTLVWGCAAPGPNTPSTTGATHSLRSFAIRPDASRAILGLAMDLIARDQIATRVDLKHFNLSFALSDPGSAEQAVSRFEHHTCNHKNLQWSRRFLALLWFLE